MVFFYDFISEKKQIYEGCQLNRDCSVRHGRWESGKIGYYDLQEFFERQCGRRKVICVFVFTDCEKALTVTRREHKSRNLNGKVMPLQ